MIYSSTNNKEKEVDDIIKLNAIYNPLYTAKTLEVTCEVLKPLQVSQWLHSANYETVVVVIDMVAAREEARKKKEPANFDMSFIEAAVKKELLATGVLHLDFSIEKVYPRH